VIALSCDILLSMTEEWLTQDEAAKRLHVALDTMRRWVREGLFPRTRVGKRYLIPAKALEEFLQSRLQTGARPVTPRKNVHVHILGSSKSPKEPPTTKAAEIPIPDLQKSKTSKAPRASK
jgi:excisionase family DNA binding protein